MPSFPGARARRIPASTDALPAGCTSAASSGTWATEPRKAAGAGTPQHFDLPLLSAEPRGDTSAETLPDHDLLTPQGPREPGQEEEPAGPLTEIYVVDRTDALETEDILQTRRFRRGPMEIRGPQRRLHEASVMDREISLQEAVRLLLGGDLGQPHLLPEASRRPARSGPWPAASGHGSF